MIIVKKVTRVGYVSLEKTKLVQHNDL